MALRDVIGFRTEINEASLRAANDFLASKAILPGVSLGDVLVITGADGAERKYHVRRATKAAWRLIAAGRVRTPNREGE